METSEITSMEEPKSTNILNKIFSKKSSSSRDSSVEKEKVERAPKGKKWKRETARVDEEIKKLRAQLDELARNQSTTKETISSSDESSSDGTDDDYYPLRRSLTELEIDNDKNDKYPNRTERKSRKKDRGEFLQAVKSAKELAVGQPTSSNIAAWLRKFWGNIGKAFPTLTDGEKIRVVISRLPNDISSFLTASECENRRELFNMISTLYAYGALDSNNAYQRFYSASPKRGATMLTFLAELMDLAAALDLSKNGRHTLVLKRLVYFLPFYFKNIIGANLENAVKSGEKIVITSILRPILEDCGAVAEIERIFRNGEHWKEAGSNFVRRENYQKEKTNNSTSFPPRVQNQAKGQTSQTMTQPTNNATQPKQVNAVNASVPPPAKTSTPKSCGKCGGFNHLTFQCLLYYKESTFPCPNCLKFFGAKHYHHPGLCRANTKN